MNKIVLLSLLSISFCFSCKRNTDKPKTKEPVIEQIEVKPFTLPDMPIVYTEPEQQTQFLAGHYWDNFDFSDTIYIHHPEITEQAWVNYLNILNFVSLNDAQVSVSRLMENAGTNNKIYKYFLNLSDKYLYDPNSPYRNEELYIPVLENILKSDLLTDNEKIRPAERLEMAYKNRPGQKAINFTYTLESGNKGNLYSLSSPYILLYFHNPGCHACEEIATAIKKSIRIQQKLSEKQMTILTVYPDEDLTEWKKHLHEFPKEWINGYDKNQNLHNDKLYDLKAIPTLYLLDKNKVILLKDTTVPAIEDYLIRY